MLHQDQLWRGPANGAGKGCPAGGGAPRAAGSPQDTLTQLAVRLWAVEPAPESLSGRCPATPGKQLPELPPHGPALRGPPSTGMTAGPRLERRSEQRGPHQCPKGQFEPQKEGGPWDSAGLPGIQREIHQETTRARRGDAQQGSWALRTALQGFRQEAPRGGRARPRGSPRQELAESGPPGASSFLIWTQPRKPGCSEQQLGRHDHRDHQARQMS